MRLGITTTKHCSDRKMHKRHNTHTKTNAEYSNHQRLWFCDQKPLISFTQKKEMQNHRLASFSVLCITIFFFSANKISSQTLLFHRWIIKIAGFWFSFNLLWFLFLFSSFLNFVFNFIKAFRRIHPLSYRITPSFTFNQTNRFHHSTLTSHLWQLNIAEKKVIFLRRKIFRCRRW